MNTDFWRDSAFSRYFSFLAIEFGLKFLPHLHLCLCLSVFICGSFFFFFPRRERLQ